MQNNQNTYNCACTFTIVRALLLILRALLQMCVHFYQFCVHFYNCACTFTNCACTFTIMRSLGLMKLMARYTPAPQQMNGEITKTTNEHRRQSWRRFLETLDHKSDPNKRWRTIKAIDGKSPPMAGNEAITLIL